MPRIDFKPSAANLPLEFVRISDSRAAGCRDFVAARDDGNEYVDGKIGNT
jgi:hypothetical protein